MADDFRPEEDVPPEVKQDEGIAPEAQFAIPPELEAAMAEDPVAPVELPGLPEGEGLEPPPAVDAIQGGLEAPDPPVPVGDVGWQNAVEPPPAVDAIQGGLEAPDPPVPVDDVGWQNAVEPPAMPEEVMGLAAPEPMIPPGDQGAEMPPGLQSQIPDDVDVPRQGPEQLQQARAFVRSLGRKQRLQQRGLYRGSMPDAPTATPFPEDDAEEPIELTTPDWAEDGGARPPIQSATPDWARDEPREVQGGGMGGGEIQPLLERMIELLEDIAEKIENAGTLS
jgi:hypothetical protein